MQKISKFIKGHVRSQSQGDVSAQVHLANDAFPQEQDIYRYRKQRGVNLGSWFVLEKWIADSPFRSAASPGSSDLDVARGENARAILEHHWDTWITDVDWAYVASKGINTVRIPIGYYHLCGADPSVLPGTDFADFQHVFEGAWPRITAAIESAYRHGIGVLLDLHAAPGKQNHDSHAGTSNNPKFFSNKKHMHHAVHVLEVLLSQVKAFCNSRSPPLPNVVGIELLNEPQPNGNHKALENWYTDATRALRSIDSTIPIVLSDCWWTENYVNYVASAKTPLLVIDHHLYRCFTSGDAATPVSQHIQNLSDTNAGTPKQFATAVEKLESAGGGLIVGEWSGALNPKSLEGLGSNESAAKRDYVKAELDLFERLCSGWFFWTYKKEHGGDTGWSWRTAVEQGVFPPWIGLRASRTVDDPNEIQERRDAARDKSLGTLTKT
ncbi:glycoside hydrolase [Punctularia strigosozonata HHB-11173 SS5]|uniref:glycoside hydrolase n=1 Tax=Punctularia strigosozonata (strain HHB-11173) TaxID=741275 RepID=UPI00044175FD|nr:glycoside hydrolase [Punctularia strigosozonata HHB-11173 SS5]EIN08135.1 glycoside hydrolase [Punctularia strigosozonata HHB-11173 SS5]